MNYRRVLFFTCFLAIVMAFPAIGWTQGKSGKPTVSIVSPADNAVIPNPSTVTIEANASDTDGIQQVDFFVDKLLITTDATSPYSATWSVNVPGNYTVTAKAIDTRNKFRSHSIIVTVDNMPEVELVAPVDGASFFEGNDIVLSATASDSDGVVARVDFYSGITLLGSANDNPYAFTWNSVAPGTYELKAVAVDNLDVQTESEIAIITVQPSPENFPPEISLISPTNNAVFEAPATVVIEAEASDSDGTVASVEFFFGTTSLGTVTSSPFVFTWSSVAGGSYNLNALATDNEGATAQSGIISITVVAPFVPSRGDFDGDGKADLLFRRNTTGENLLWKMDGVTFVSEIPLPARNDGSKIVATGDFSGDGIEDVVWRNTASGANTIWVFDDTNSFTTIPIRSETTNAWKIVAAGDLDNDGSTDIIWRNSVTGENRVWLLDGTDFLQEVELNSLSAGSSRIEGTGDFNNDGKTDILWRNYANGSNFVWLMDGSVRIASVKLQSFTNLDWHIAATADYNNDGHTDIVFRNFATGANKVWIMNQTSRTGVVGLPSKPISWKLVGPR